MTARDLITSSLKLLGALAPGESLEASEATDALGTLNRLLDSWSNESLLIYSRVREEFTLTSGDGSYTMGSSANFNTSRPIWIEAATIEDQSSTPTVETPLVIIRDVREWAQIRSKDTSSAIPTYVFLEGTYPNETLNFYPVPSSANKAVLYSRKVLTQISALGTSLSFPPGYERALVFNLAMDLAPEYGRPIPDIVMVVATESKALLKRTNQKPSFLRVDDIPANQSSRFNILTGDFNR